MKKNLQSVTANLTDLAATMPTQRPLSVVSPEPVVPPVTPRAAPSERLVQFSFSMRQSLRHELNRLAVENNLTMRVLVLDALKQTWGLNVTDDDLLDMRKAR